MFPGTCAEATETVPSTTEISRIFVGMQNHGSCTGKLSRIQIPERCHPLAKMVFAEMRRQGVTYDELEWRSGVLRSTFKAWRTHNKPGLESIEAALGALGWSVLPVPIADRVLPDSLRADLQAVAAKHGLSSLPAIEYLREWIGFTWPDCSIAARRRQNQQNERLAA